MSEHEYLVHSLLEHCKTKYGGSDKVLYYLDKTGIGSQQRPELINGSRPDIYGKRFSDGLEIIGEAKTRGDLETARSEKQFRDYGSYVCPRNCILLAIVPITYVRACRALILHVCPELRAHPGKLEIVPGGSV